MSAAAAGLVAAALAAGCSGGAPEATGPTPPDRVTVIARGGGVDRLQVTLDCAVADREACEEVLAAAAHAGDPERCTPEDGGDRTLQLDGTIGGRRVRAVLARRTDCEIAAYDAAARAVGL